MHTFKQRFFVVLIMLLTVFPVFGKDTLNRIDSARIAASHPITVPRPAPNFFEGALLGNGGLGAVVTTRPDAVVIHFGHNNVWDIRLAEDNKEKIGTFREIFDRISAIPDTLRELTDDPWYRDYLKIMRENYAKPYPRPFPCGSAVLWFDRREAELLGHTLHIDSGTAVVDFLIGGSIHHLEIFTDLSDDVLWAQMTGPDGNPVPSPFAYITLIPDPETPKELPMYTAMRDDIMGFLSFAQILPFEEITESRHYRRHPKDKFFRLTAHVNGGFPDTITLPHERRYSDMTIPGYNPDMVQLKAPVNPQTPFVMTVRLQEGNTAADTGPAGTSRPSASAFNLTAKQNVTAWNTYWNRSGVSINDEILERTWYQNLYFLKCALRPGVTCPGLFANWSYRNIGTAWHGDYHMNYNTQQPFWATFSSNHVDLHIPYVDMVEKTLLPVSRKWAKEYYGMRGAFFPHSAYPVEMSIMPYPLPTWGWEICETPWTVQSLWWHYEYTQDTEYLRDRAFEPIRDAVLFLVDYMTRPEAHGPEWDDTAYHIFPSVPPELYGLRPGFDKNSDILVDLSLTRFIFNAYLEACTILSIEHDGKALAHKVRDILAHFPEYPTAQSKRGKVFVSVAGEDPEIVYNCPASLMSVFPGEEHGLHSPEREYTIAVNTYKNQQNEGGNDIVFLNLQAARLGMLNLEKFKRQIEYCRLPNGTCCDKVLQIHGRYTNNTPFDFMERMGIWFENFSLPVVLNECMLQSYTGTLRFFPNWPKNFDAAFTSLRTVGAFLVSAELSDGHIQWIEITSEKGGTLSFMSPWKTGVRIETLSGTEEKTDSIITLETKTGETVTLKQANI